MIVRPVRSSDLPALIDLARSTGTGLTTLPANEERLAHRVGWAEKTFRGEAGRGDADYLFVLEDDEGRVVGISAIAGAVGLREPWYNFRVGLTVSASQELNIYREIPTLFLANDLTGNSELCSLFLHADYRSGLNGRMLSKARMLFIAEFPQLFGNKIIAEMRGVSDEAGRSPFWESLGRHFFKMEFSQADYLTGVGNKAFIAELMPKFPLYTCFLSEGAQRDRPVHPTPSRRWRCSRAKASATRATSTSSTPARPSSAKPPRSARCATARPWCWPSARRVTTPRRSSSTTASAKTAASLPHRHAWPPARWWSIR
jgi:arginine N-succinyltransferase